LADVYKRTTFQCDDLGRSDLFTVAGNIRLTFSPCDALPTATATP
jgi:hypothetical protein